MFEKNQKKNGISHEIRYGNCVIQMSVSTDNILLQLGYTCAYMSAMAFVPRQAGAVATESIGPANPEVLIICPAQKVFA